MCCIVCLSSHGPCFVLDLSFTVLVFAVFLRWSRPQHEVDCIKARVVCRSCVVAVLSVNLFVNFAARARLSMPPLTYCSLCFRSAVDPLLFKFYCVV
jgi:hypothetical protein